MRFCNNLTKTVLLFSLAALAFTGCSKKTTKTGVSTVNTNYVEAPELPSQAELQKLAETEVISDKVDIDLTTMSSTIIYSYVFDMLMDADSYKDKTFKIKGFFQSFVNDNSEDHYFTIIIPDATACCQQGLEFIWKGNHTYPDDYPELEQEITAIGKYKVFTTKDGIQYAYLLVQDIQ